MSTDAFAPLKTTSAKPATKPDEWTPVTPVPDDAPPPPKRHSKLGAPSQKWTYHTANGEILAFAYRFDTADGGKEFLPLTWCRNSKSGKTEWRWKGQNEPRSLYRLDEIAKRPTAPVLVTEGEKAADAAQLLLPDLVTTTSPNGSKSARKSDWSALTGRNVIIWPDADEPGSIYAAAVAELCQLAGAASIYIIQRPDGLASGFDAADALSEGWSAERLQALISGAKKPEMTPADNGADKNVDEGAKPKSAKRKPQKQQVFDFIDDRFEFWHDRERENFVTYPVGDHFEHAPVRHRFFKNHIAGLFYEKTAGPLGAAALDDALRVMEAQAQNGPCYPTARRVSQDAGCIYLDLCDSDWRCVKVAAHGWSVGQFPHVKFLRSNSARALAAPREGGSLQILRSYINTRDDDDFNLICAWLAGSLKPTGPYPILAVSGEQGSGKSSATDLLASLIDPGIGKKQTVPKDERDLVIGAVNAHVLAFDNMSSVANWFSDALCRLSTGGGFATRMLHSDSDQLVLEAQRPIVLNGIPDLTGRADLADRSIAIHLPRIAEGQRRTEREIKAGLERDIPFILGALMDAVSAGLRNRASIKLDNPPRMADFAEWVEACAPAFGWQQGAFLATYQINRSDAAKVALENDPFGSELVRIISEHRRSGFTGSASRLLEMLNEHVPERIKNSRAWPSMPAHLGTLVRRAAPLLRAEGYEVSDSRNADGRTIKITPMLAASKTDDID